MTLPSIPLGQREAIKQALFLERLLKAQSLSKVISNRLKSFTQWKKQAHPVLRRMQRQYSLVYTIAELRMLIKQDIINYTSKKEEE